MAKPPAAAFDSLESAHEYVGLLCEVLDDAQRLISEELGKPSPMTRARHLDALRLVEYKLTTLRRHFVDSRRLLTDLRSLRRYLLDERAADQIAQSSSGPEASTESQTSL